MNKRFLILAVIYLSGLSAPINQFKVPPMMLRLTDDLGITLGTSGWLMTVFALVGLVCAIPAGVYIRRYSHKIAGLSALWVLLAGSLVGTVSHSMTLMLLSRVLEGAGMCVISISAPAAIAELFPPEKRGVPTGIWVTWVPVGSMVIYVAAPLIGTTGWQPVWWFASAYTALMFILYLLIIPNSGKISTTEKEGSSKSLPKPVFLRVSQIAATFMLFNMITISVKSYLPSYLEQFRDYSTAHASGILNIMIVVSVIMGPVAGLIADRSGSRKKVIVVGCICAVLSIPLLFIAKGISVAAGLFLLGISCGNIAATSFIAAAETAGKGKDTALSIVVFGQYAGMATGPILFSMAAHFFSWFYAAALLTGIALAAWFCAHLTKQDN